MPHAPLRLGAEIDLGFDAIRAELGIVTAFPDAVLAEAEEAARRGPTEPAARDLRSVPFVTIDPPGSRDLDQAVAIERRGGGHRVRYAIADVAAFVRPGGAIDQEARRRGVTVYLPDERAPLHPPVLSEGAVSLLPDGDRQALVWTIDLDAQGEPTSVSVERALVRSRRAYGYPEAQAELDGGSAPEVLVGLREVGLLRQARERDRGGVSLDLPDQIVVRDGDRYDVRFRAPLPVEGWNAQISLLTGIVAARLMLDAGVGVLRTVPPPEDEAVAQLRRRAVALGVAWPATTPYAAFVTALDAARPLEAALLLQAARTLRGAGYAAFDGEPPAQPLHGAVAAPYAHVTAPLRRLVDRPGNEVVLAACAGRRPPAWALELLPQLPDLMADARRREGAADRAAVDLVEAAVLAARSGEVLDATVTEVDGRGSVVQLRSPAVVARLPVTGLSPGQAVRVRVVGADLVRRAVDLALHDGDTVVT